MVAHWIARCLVLTGIVVQLTMTSDNLTTNPSYVETYEGAATETTKPDVEDAATFNTEPSAAEDGAAKFVGNEMTSQITSMGGGENEVTPHLEGKSITVNIPGILIENNGSAACSDITLENIRYFSLCFFLQLKDELSNKEFNNTILEFWNNKTLFQLQYSYDGYLIINYSGLNHGHPTSINFSDWTRICVAILQTFDETAFELTLNINYTEFHTTLLRTNFDSETSIEDSAVTMCIGNRDPLTSSVVGSVVGLTLNPHHATYDPCIFAKGEHIFTPTYLLESPEFFVGNAKAGLYDQTRYCWDSNVLLILEEASTFDQHFARCQRNLNGRLILYNEVKSYTEELKNVFKQKVRSGREFSGIFRTHSWIDNVTAPGIDNDGLCTAFNFREGRFDSIKCKYKLEFNLCMAQKYSSFLLFGSISEFDRRYTVDAKNYSLVLNGDDGSTLERGDKFWTLKSKYHKEYLALHNKSIPVGRNKWRSSAGEKGYLLTFTNCKGKEFTCSSGECLEIYDRCNGIKDCADASDEEKCNQINKKFGYRTNESPPRRKNKPKFTIDYLVTIDMVSKISLDDGIAKVSATFKFSWNDSRIIFNSQSSNTKLNCDEIWIPKINIEDVMHERVTMEIIDSESRWKGCRLKNNAEFTLSEDDPYMDSYADGLDIELMYEIDVLIPMSCDFNLAKYPFGIQTCSIKGWLEASDVYLMNGKMQDIEETYIGDYDLGEFNLVGVSHEMNHRRESFNLSLSLQIQYGYHMLNSFLPSFLFFLICYATLFLPVGEFSDRYVGSLTGLLVLVALFIQISESSVRTSYFKYLDIWFAVLIAFCFFITIANVLIHRLKVRKDYVSSNDIFKTRVRSVKDLINICANNVNAINRVFQVVFALCFMAFLFLSLSAAELI